LSIALKKEMDTKLKTRVKTRTGVALAFLGIAALAAFAAFSYKAKLTPKAGKVLVTLPDLAIDITSASCVATSTGTAVAYSLAYSNIGATDVSYTEFRVYGIKKDGTTAISTITVPTIPLSSGGTGTFTGTISPGLPGLEASELAKLRAVIDWEDTITESNETNNEDFQTIVCP
jgi:hypothetical protein